jgi:hypothetical protein
MEIPGTNTQNSAQLRLPGRALFQGVTYEVAQIAQEKKSVKFAANNRWQFSPPFGEKKIKSLSDKRTKPPSEMVLAKIPLLRLWLRRKEAEKSNALQS